MLKFVFLVVHFIIKEGKGQDSKCPKKFVHGFRSPYLRKGVTMTVEPYS